MVLPAVDLQYVDQVIDRYRAKRSKLLHIVIEAQDPEGWLPPAAITRIAQAVRRPSDRVEDVASSHAFLHLTPAGRDRVRCSDNISDCIAGSSALQPLRYALARRRAAGAPAAGWAVSCASRTRRSGRSRCGRSTA